MCGDEGVGGDVFSVRRSARDLCMELKWEDYREERGRENLRELRELCVRCVPHFHGVDVTGNNVLKMGRQSRAIDCRAGAWEADSLSDVKDDGRKAVFIEIYFLVVGDLTERADFVS